MFDSMQPTTGAVDICLALAAIWMVGLAFMKSPSWGLFCLALPLGAGWLAVSMSQQQSAGYALAALMLPLAYAPFLLTNLRASWVPFTLFLLAICVKGSMVAG